MPRRRFEERLAGLTARAANGCLIFVGAKNASGYGYVFYEGRTWQAHRAVYTYFREAIPEGMQIDHLCREPSCVELAHLEVVTYTENRRRREDAQRDTCARGHLYTGVHGNKGERRCVECRRASARRKYRQHREVGA